MQGGIQSKYKKIVINHLLLLFAAVDGATSEHRRKSEYALKKTDMPERNISNELGMIMLSYLLSTPAFLRGS